MISMNNLPTDVATLQSMLLQAYTDRAYGCLTRAGLEALHQYSEGREVIFLDLDGMHDLNTKYGYAEVDARIAGSLAAMRSSDVICARWYSGDEIVLIVPAGTAMGAAHRLLGEMVSRELSATFGISGLTQDLAESVAAASSKVQDAKSRNERGTVNA